jgi:hypothetical protein
VAEDDDQGDLEVFDRVFDAADDGVVEDLEGATVGDGDE